MHTLQAADLCLTINPEELGFNDTGELVHQALPWIGQARAEAAARFGLQMEQPSYNLFVLGEVGSGRSSLLEPLMNAVAADRPVPPDLCYIHNFDTPERPLAMRMPAGQGRELRQLMATLVKSLQEAVPKCLEGPAFKTEAEQIQRRYTTQESAAYTELAAFGKVRDFVLRRDDERLVFSQQNAQGDLLSEKDKAELPATERTRMDLAEMELRTEINRFLEKTAALERTTADNLAALRRQVVKPLVERGLQGIRLALKKHIKDSVKLGGYLDRVQTDVLEHLELFKVFEPDDASRQEALAAVLSRYRVNVVVDNGNARGAPVIIDNNPLYRQLFGSMEYQPEEDVLVTDFTRIRAGSLLRAHGGFLMLHLSDLLSDPLVWETLRRFLRTSQLQIEEPGTSLSPMAAVSLQPEAVLVQVKIVLISSVELYYELQEADPEFARHFRAKVDFADSFVANSGTRRATAIFVAQQCKRLGLPHFSAAATARLLESTHREADDQTRQSGIFSRTEALLTESAVLCRARGGTLVEANDVDRARRAHHDRHDYLAQRLQESILEGDRLIALSGERVGQLNGLTQMDLGDHRFGSPVCITARTCAGHGGLLNIEREVKLSGPIHDKGVLILQSHLSALFSHLAPLALSASVVFEQEYQGVEGDSASCAELYALLSCLSGLPLRQGLAVTGAVNQHGEVLPVGGLNEKIEGYFRLCAKAGLNGHQGVVIPARNRRHLMLDADVREAVAQGLFQVFAVSHVTEGLELLTGQVAGTLDGRRGYPEDTVLGRAQATLQSYRLACLQSPRRLGRRH